MAFGKITKADLVEAGLDPDKFTELVGKSVTKEQLEALKTELTTSIQTSITDQIKAGFTELETKLAPKGRGGNGGGGDNNDDGNKGSTQPTPEEEQLEFATDPTGYVKKKVGALGSAALIEFKNMARNLAWDTMKGNTSLIGFHNAELLNEITEEWKKYPAELFARNNGDPAVTLRQVHDMVIGRHHADIKRDSDKKEGKYNIVQSDSSSSSFNNGSNNNSNKGPNDKRTITPDEQVLARKFGMSDEEWMKQEEDMEKEEKDRHKKGLVGAGV